MEYDVKASDPSHCEAEGRYRGYVVKVFGRTDINTGRWRMEVYFLKLGEYGQAPIAMHKLGTTTVSAGSSAEVFVLGFAMAEAEIDSYFSAR
jgi:hypothetical protein